MRIAILGAGAMGSWFGGLLALQNNDVQLITTNVAHRKAIAENGLLLRGPDGEQRVSITALSPEDFTTPVDLVMLMTKTFQTIDAITKIQQAIDKNTHFLSLQNGLGNAQAIAQFVPIERVWIGVTMLPIDKVAPGIVEGRGRGDSYFGNAADSNDTATAQRIESVFQSAQIELQHAPDIHKRIWEKVAFNAGMNALTALSNGTPGLIDATPGAKELACRVAQEVALVADSVQVKIDLAQVYDMVTLSCTKHTDHISSMLQDLQLGRRTEVDALNGAVVRIAKQTSTPAPVNATLTTLIKLAELSHQKHL